MAIKFDHQRKIEIIFGQDIFLPKISLNWLNMRKIFWQNVIKLRVLLKFLAISHNFSSVLAE